MARRDVMEQNIIIFLVTPNQTTSVGQKRTTQADMATPISPITILTTCNIFDSFIYLSFNVKMETWGIPSQMEQA